MIKKKKFAINAIREVRSLGERERGFTKKKTKMNRGKGGIILKVSVKI